MRPKDTIEMKTVPIMLRDWSSLTTGEGLVALQDALPAWLMQQRWFGAKSQTVTAALPSSYTVLSDDRSDDHSGFAIAAAFIVEVHYDDDRTETYQVPLAVSFGEAMEVLRNTSPQSVVLTLSTSQGAAVLHDATTSAAFRNALLHSIQRGATAAMHSLSGHSSEPTPVHAEIVASSGTRLSGEAVAAVSTSSVSKAEQSNTSILYDRSMILKLFRRLQPGTNPDIEVGRYLSDVAHFPRIAALLGEITLHSTSAGCGEASSLAMLQPLVANEGDCWEWTLNALQDFYQIAAELPAPDAWNATLSFTSEAQVPTPAAELFGGYVNAATLLGRRTAELHVALSAETTDAAFQPEPFTAATLEADAERATEGITKALSLLQLRLRALDDSVSGDAAAVLGRSKELHAMVGTTQAAATSGSLTRIHGDYHLGQVLRTQDDFVLLDFEGEPARPLADRRRKQCPLRDVAGMLRSFSYASWAAVESQPRREATLSRWAKCWRDCNCSAFLAGYRAAAAERSGLLPEPALAESLLRIYLLEKAMYELVYELNNRPTWVRVPLAGILDLLGENGTRPAA